MEKYLTYISEFHENNPKEIEFVNNHLKKHLESNEEKQTEIETILDYLYSNQNVDISIIGYTTILEKTEKWHKKLQSVATKDTEIEGVDYEVFMDFGDGFKVVRLISQECYQREGKLMSHCVASYYGRSSKIYSLRDSKNLPHCTIEDGNQIKGKGNGNIDPKYIDYIVKFLEKTGMTVGENEMKNLGYYKIDKIDEGLTSEFAYNGYIYEGKLNTLMDKEGRLYKGMGIWNVKPVCEIQDDGKFRLYEDIKTIVAYEKLVNKGDGHSTRNASSGDYTQNASSGHYTRNASSGDSTQNASSGYSTQNASSGDSTRNASSGDSTQNASSGDYTRNASSGHSTQNASSGYYTRNASSGDSTQNASSGHSTQNASSGDSTQNASSGDYTRNASSGDYTQNASSGDSTQNASSGDSTQNASSGDYTQNASSGDSTQNASSGHSTQNASSGDYTQNASSGDYTRTEVNGKYGITADIGKYSISKGIIGTWIVLAEYAKNNDGYWYPKFVKCGQIDGINLKENTWYTLENGDFVETK